MSWTDERIELLSKLWLEGSSASQIAAILANGVTRNAVIGKVHRLGLSGRAKTGTQANTRPKPKVTRGPSQRPTQPMVRGNTALALQTRPAPAPVQRPTQDVVIPISERVTIMELREAMCRWPIGDPGSVEFRYCGSKSPGGGEPYCVPHQRIAYQPAQDRRRDRRPQQRVG